MIIFFSAVNISLNQRQEDNLQLNELTINNVIMNELLNNKAVKLL